MKSIFIGTFAVALAVIPASISCARDSGVGSSKFAEKFPECVKHPIGASSWLECNFDQARKTWKICRWHGWGDCQAGCVDRVVDECFETDADGKLLKSLPVPPDSRVAPQARVQRAGPDREVVWVGRSVVVGQCQGSRDGASPEKGPSISPAGAQVLKRAARLDVTTGPIFNAWNSSFRKAEYDRNPNSFTCKACDVCKTFAMDYMLVYEKDANRFPGYMRVDE